MIRPPLSVVESLDNEKVLHWIKDIQMPTIDEECASIHSGEASKDDMLKCIYGITEKSTKDGQKKENDVSKISTSEDQYISESVVFYSHDRHSSINSSTMSSDDFQAVLGHYYSENDSQDVTKKKQNVPCEDVNYNQTFSTSNGGSYVDYRTAPLSRNHQNQTATVPLDYIDESVFEVTKQLEDNNDTPYVPGSEDTGMYSTSCFSDSSIPPLDGGYTSCSIAMHPGGKTISYIPSVTSPTSPTPHHSDQSMPIGEYVDHDVALQWKSNIV